MPFAEYTKVPISKTQHDIDVLVAKRGATTFALFREPDSAMVAFRMNDRNIRFKLSLPKKLGEQGIRSRWRALLLVIKAKLESVDAGIETFEESFLPHIVMPGGNTVYETIRSPIAINYEGGNVPLLPPPGSNS